jgi:hypothetical protein
MEPSALEEMERLTSTRANVFMMSLPYKSEQYDIMVQNMMKFNTKYLFPD